jgi:Uma2 family endonuclease
MARHVIPEQRMPVSAFLTLQEAADMRYEFVAGWPQAMAGASFRHSRLVMRISAALFAAEAGGPCQVATQDVNVQVAQDTIYLPDVVAICDPTDSHPRIKHRPCLIVEVLSPSTKDIDRREKLVAYQRLSSLQAYLIVYQNEQRVDRHWRDADNVWQGEILHGDVSVNVPCLDIELSLSALYRNLPPVDE